MSSTPPNNGAGEAPPPPLTIGTAGHIDHGKTLLIEALTGMRARVGNYPGVTVERREGSVRGAGRDVALLDLPGTYSLEPETPDEAVVTRLLEGGIAGESLPDAVVVVIDATAVSFQLVEEVFELLDFLIRELLSIHERQHQRDARAVAVVVAK